MTTINHTILDAYTKKFDLELKSNKYGDVKRAMLMRKIMSMGELRTSLLKIPASLLYGERIIYLFKRYNPYVDKYLLEIGHTRDIMSTIMRINIDCPLVRVCALMSVSEANYDENLYGIAETCKKYKLSEYMPTRDCVQLIGDLYYNLDARVGACFSTFSMKNNQEIYRDDDGAYEQISLIVSNKQKSSESFNLDVEHELFGIKDLVSIIRSYKKSTLIFFAKGKQIISCNFATGEWKIRHDMELPCYGLWHFCSIRETLILTSNTCMMGTFNEGSNDQKKWSFDMLCKEDDLGVTVALGEIGGTLCRIQIEMKNPCAMIGYFKLGQQWKQVGKMTLDYTSIHDIKVLLRRSEVIVLSKNITYRLVPKIEVYKLDENGFAIMDTIKFYRELKGTPYTVVRTDKYTVLALLREEHLREDSLSESFSPMMFMYDGINWRQLPNSNHKRTDCCVTTVYDRYLMIVGGTYRGFRMTRFETEFIDLDDVDAGWKSAGILPKEIDDVVCTDSIFPTEIGSIVVE